MKIKLLAFASAAEALGTGELDYQLGQHPNAQPNQNPGTPTVGELKLRLSEEYPSLGELWQRIAVSVEGEIASDAHPLADGNEVALLPPVSGG